MYAEDCPRLSYRPLTPASALDLLTCSGMCMQPRDTGSNDMINRAQCDKFDIKRASS